MADYYLAESGSDYIKLADNSSAAPFKTASRLNQESLSSGDTVTISGLIRGQLNCASEGVTYLFQDGSAMLPTWDVSHGSMYTIQQGAMRNAGANEADINWMQIVDASAPWNGQSSGTGSSTAEETAEQLVGARCLRCVAGANVASYAGAAFLDVKLPEGTNRISILNYGASAGGTLKIAIRTETSAEYLATNGTFSSLSEVFHTVTKSSGAWGISHFDLSTINGATIPDSARYRIYVRFYGYAGGATTNYLQGIFVSPTVSWSADIAKGIADLYVCDLWANLGQQTLATRAVAQFALAKCTDQEWLDNGVDALSLVQDAETLAGIAAGEWFWDNTNKKLYYRLASGESIADLHFEFGPYRYAAYVTANSVFINNPKLLMGSVANLYSDGVTGLTTYGMDTSLSWGYGVKDNNSTVHHIRANAHDNNNLLAEQYGSNGFLCNTTATVTYEGCVAEDNGDDGFQVIAAATQMTMIGCVSKNNLSAQVTVTGPCKMYQSTIIDDGVGETQAGIDDTSASGVLREYKDVVVYYLHSFTGVDIDNATGVTSDNNYWYEPNVTQPGVVDTRTRAASFTTNENANTETDPQIDSTGCPLTGSNLRKAGSPRWTLSNPRPVGANGIPYPDRNIDLGGVQSTARAI